MQDPDKLQEIERLGEEDEGLEELEEERGRSSISTVPILQVVLCALALGALVFLKCTDQKTYNTVTRWYQSEAAQEIELPKWNGGQAEATPSPSPEPASSGAPTIQTDGASLQRV